MSQQLISRSTDLKRLRDEGFDLAIKSGYLVVRDVPYVNERKEVKRGVLVAPLALAGEKTTTPPDHVVDFQGENPCDQSGRILSRIIIENSPRSLASDLVVSHKFSSKPIPLGSYRDYYEKISAYVAILEGFARAIDPAASARTFPAVRDDSNDSPFNYVDTATSRAGIGVSVDKLKLSKVAIIGLGGTGSYILDLVAKTPVREIHLFDGDAFLTHNAFRAPGAASIAALDAKRSKVDYFKDVYSEMRRGIQAHAFQVDHTNVSALEGMEFVFIAIDAGESKRAIFEALERSGTPFIDVGLGISQIDDALTGLLRVTTSVPAKRDHLRLRVSLGAEAGRDEYERNIQIADLNALNAALAVIRWKRFCGFYLDFEQEHHATYSIDCNVMTNDEHI